MNRFLSFIAVFFFVAGALASDYSEYAELLNRHWPLNLDPSQECQNHDPHFWMGKAERMISVEPLKQRFALNDDEVMVLRNLLISQAYNRLFVHSLRVQQTEIPVMKFFWIAAGSQASVTVGHALQVGLADKYPLGSRQRKIFRRLESLYPDVPGVPALLLKNIGKVKAKTAENNWRVYSDIYWQHLAYMTCGFDKIVLLNKTLVAEKTTQKKFDEARHYEKFISVWQDMEEGRYLAANLKLVWIEQHNILQRYMYNGIDAKTANAFLLFNSMAKADLAGADGKPLESFTEYSLNHGLYPNLSHFPSRFKWMTYVVSGQAAYLESRESVAAIEAVLQRSLKESYQFVNDYLSLRKSAISP
ncbi:DUF2515 family protein [Bdellovibrio bacteriovorus]|uniref:DUF2515 family protein n=1 Tax=Bdellovibrio bacteriovorus TaxID=959 RepID=UPI0035A607A6